MSGKAVYTEITCDSAATKNKRNIPCGWDANIYRGCAHGCKYCYALYSHKYIGSLDFFNDIYVKKNFIDELEKQLSAPSWNRETINFGGVTDSYQPIEAKYRLMPEVLKLLIKYKTPVIISTKSTLALRDYDLIDELSRIAYVNIAATITTADENVRRKIEPYAASSEARFKMLKEFRKTNASVGLHMMPIIPYITDSYKNLNALLIGAKDSDVSYVLPGTMRLRGQTREYFFKFIAQSFNELYMPLKALYKTGSLSAEYKNNLYSMLLPLMESYGLSADYAKPMKEKMHRQQPVAEQLTLF
ncbi:MAG TPA: radical SAM protein [Ruminococcaceae bacterium]|nr:radical SAM protein [Oscillospiraceae bacterium]